MKQVARSGCHLLGAIEDGCHARSAPSRRHSVPTQVAGRLNVQGLRFLLQRKPSLAHGFLDG